jgi:hypothetical protein
MDAPDFGYHPKAVFKQSPIHTFQLNRGVSMLLRIFTISCSFTTLALVAGCTTPAATTADANEARERPVYRTGSNLPVKDPSQKSEVGSVSGDTYQNQAQPALLRPNPIPTGK